MTASFSLNAGTQPDTPLINDFVDYALWNNCPTLDKEKTMPVVLFRDIVTFMYRVTSSEGR